MPETGNHGSLECVCESARGQVESPVVCRLTGATISRRKQVVNVTIFPGAWHIICRHW